MQTVHKLWSLMAVTEIKYSLRVKKNKFVQPCLKTKNLLCMSEQLFLPVWWVTEKRRNDGNDSNHFYIITGICAGLPADHHICDPSVYKGWLQNCVTFSATIFRAFLEVLSWPLVCWMHRMYKPVWYDSVLSQASRWAFYTLPAGVLKSDVLWERRIRFLKDWQYTHSQSLHKITKQ